MRIHDSKIRFFLRVSRLILTSVAMIPFLALFAANAYAKTNSPVLDQSSFIFRNDDGAENAATAMASVNTNVTDVPKSTNFRLRMQSNQSASSPSPTTDTPAIAYKLASGGACTDATGWTTITTATTNAFALSLSTYFADKAATTQTGGGMTAPSGSSWVAGQILETSNPASAWTYSNKSYSEHEWSMIATTNAANNTAYIFRVTNNGTAYNTYSVCPQLTTRNPTTILGNGTDPSNSTIGPGASATEIDRFSFQTNTSTDAVTALTVTLGPSGAYNNIATVAVQTTGGSTLCSATPTSNTVSLSSCGISVTTTLTEYKIMITPKSPSAMDPPSTGVSYDTTATVTSWTSSLAQSGSDSGSATITVDNQSPGNVTSSSVSSGGTSVNVAWTNPTDGDFSTNVILRSTSAVTNVPTEGSSTYSVGNIIGSATVACVTSSTSCVDSSVSLGVAYYYKIFSDDTFANYSTGVEPSGSPITLSAGSPPTVSTQAPTLVHDTYATWNGTVSSTGGASVTMRGFAYGTSPTLATVIATTTEFTTGDWGANPFIFAAYGLACGTTYYNRAYASNSAGTGFGSILSTSTTVCQLSPPKLKLLAGKIKILNGILKIF